MVFVFQAEDSIRDADVTGVKTCALPIVPGRPGRRSRGGRCPRSAAGTRSEERRVGKERMARLAPGTCRTSTMSSNLVIPFVVYDVSSESCYCLCLLLYAVVMSALV